MPRKHKPRIAPFPELPELGTSHYSPDALATALGVRPGTVKRWRHDGMPSSKDEQGNVWITPSDALPWIREHARPSSFDKCCVIYFAKSTDPSFAKGRMPIKIGSSVDPRDRLRKMHVDILATVPGDKRTELAFHALFGDASLGNEWFEPVPELLELIEALKAA